MDVYHYNYLAADLKLHATKVKRSKMSDVEQLDVFKNNN